MNAKNYFLIVASVLLFLSKPVEAQINASFSADQTSGCSPLVVSFTNSSTGENLSYSWDFGNGNSSTNKDPQATYTSPGTYQVTLSISNGSSSDETTANLTVFKNPVADFQGDAKGCTPFTAQFTDISTPGDAPIEEWKWDFRSGFIDSRQNPTYTYTSEGVFDVFLEVTDGNGCSSNIEKQGFIDVARPPSSIFSFSPTAACEVPATLSFSNTSSGKGTITYEWNFGDQTTSSEKTPSHTYTSFGDYVIKLNVSSDYGCITTTEKLFKVQNISASGILLQDGKTISTDDRVCPGLVEYKSTTSPGIPVLWEFGDGTFSSDTSGAHQYAEAGTYEVRLIAAPDEACADTVSWTIHVDEIIADFSFSPEYSCKAPVEVQFTNSSTNAVSYQWKFADNSTSTEENPSKIYTIPPQENPYATSSSHLLNTTLTVTNDMGCESSTTRTLTIEKPTAQFSVDTLQGCKPLTVNFLDISQSDLDITSREWIFDDGEITGGNESEPEHIYTNDGTFNARLVITNEDNCSDTSYAVTIEVGSKLNPDFQILPTSFCQNEEIKFSNPKSLDERIDNWHYTIGTTEVPLDPSGSDTSWTTKMNETGMLDAKLSIYYNGCKSETLKSNYITSNGPVARFTSDMECSNPYDYGFIGNPENYVEVKWDFGDDSSSTSLNPTHTYLSEDNYALEFIAINGACSDTARQIIQVREPKAIITGDTAICAGDSVWFNGSNSYGQVNYCYEKYVWNFQDNSPPKRTNKDSVYHQFDYPGIYQINLITRYDNHCTDTAAKEITVYQPLVGFETDIFEGCAPLTVTFNDTSSANIHPLQSWHIDYGDDNDSSYTAFHDQFSHTYYNVGNYQVSFSVTDTFGCTGIYSREIHAANPSAEFESLTSLETCAGNPITFAHYYRESDSVRWDFGDGSYSNDTSEFIEHEYSLSGEFQPSLIVYKFGCTDTSSNEFNKVTIQKANAHFTVNDSFFNCYPELVDFTHDGTPAAEVVNGQWDFGFKSSTSAYAETRQFTYPVPGEYTISLNVETSYGCYDSYEKKIVVTGPRGSFSMSSEAICRGDEVTLTLKDTADVFSFKWDLGDGNFVEGNPVTHNYYEMGDNIPKLILSGDSGKCLPPPVEDTLYVYELQAGFNIENPALCEQSDIIFSNSSFGQTENLWKFTNGNSGSSENYASEFQPGQYEATLVVSNPYGCSDTTRQTFTVHALPTIWVMADTFICRGQTVKIKASGGDKIAWTPEAELVDPSSYESLAQPSFTTSYLAVVTDTLTRCTNQENLLITVQQPPDIHVSPADTSIIIGENVTFTTDSLSGVNYHWSPENFFPCVNCATVNATPFESTTVTLLVSDDKNCFEIPINIPVEVREEYSVDMPTSFTPNGDGNNDVLYVRGWGIKHLVEFRIFNRWGNEVFFTDNLTEGWDGTYNGKLQNIDTYAYVIRVETWEGNVLTKKGTVTLLK